MESASPDHADAFAEWSAYVQGRVEGIADARRRRVAKPIAPSLAAPLGPSTATPAGPALLELILTGYCDASAIYDLAS